jgi:hypothetical protein
MYRRIRDGIALLSNYDIIQLEELENSSTKWNKSANWCRKEIT